MQLECLTQFAAPALLARQRDTYNSIIPTYFHGDNALRSSECTWNGIGCDENGALRSMRIDNSRTWNPTLVDMQWVPPTAQTVSIRNVKLYGGFEASALPRDLRFLFLKNCMWRVGYSDIAGSLSFEKLPKKLEEMFLIGNLYRGTINIKELPKTMRILFLDSKFKREAYMRFSALPEVALGGTGRVPVTDIDLSDEVDEEPTVRAHRTIMDIEALSKFTDMLL